uniref:Transcriptional regulator n=1 Tax=Heterorhabditis bacteriophora TaxID=37862 RepID=A0A1I7WUL5_HETBA
MTHDLLLNDTGKRKFLPFSDSVGKAIKAEEREKEESQR